MKLGFALQLVTVRWVGAFLEDPLDVPVVVLDFVAGQLGIADPSQVNWRKELLGRYTTVSGFVKILPKVISFGANAEGAAVLAAMEMLPDVLAYRSRLTAPLIPARMISAEAVNGPWKRLVFGHPAYEDGAVNRHAYAFCVLEQFYRHLKRPRDPR